MNLAFLDSRLFVALVAGLLGVGLAVVTQRLLGKRGLLTYVVWHSRIGVSADDAVFGTVRVTWNGTQVANLYSSTVELRNESLEDYDNIVLRVFTTDTKLLTQRTEIVGTTRSLDWTEDYTRAIAVQPGSPPTQEQWDLYNGHRDYLVPVLNRGQVLRLTFLNSALGGNSPNVWLEVLHKGLKVKYRIAQNQFWGVPQPAATVVGIATGFVFVAFVIGLVDKVWIAAVLSAVYGLAVLAPGAFLIKVWRWIRETTGG